MKNIIKDILISQMSFPLKYKNEKEIWWEDEWGNTITVEIINIENEQYIERKYRENGQLCYKANYHQGQWHGECLAWYEDGQLWYKKNYRQGHCHGECLVLYNSGQLYHKTNYHQGQPHGEYLEWHSDGELRYKAKYNHGKLINEEHY